jgi:photosystem II stability/assembly factor-like uncharacterized protein
MKKRIFIYAPLFIVLALVFTLASNKEEQEDHGLWHAEYLKKKENREKGIKSNKEMRIKEVDKYFKGIRTKFGEDESNYPANYLMLELEKAKQNRRTFKSDDTINWVLRGPGNVGGRTRAVVVDVSDPTHNTWFAGSATGGAWKTTDGGASWVNISKDIPYHAISTLVQSPSEPNVLFIGTGESFPGSIQTTGGGVFKSTDKGESWTQLDFTASNEDFRYVNRLAIHPQDTSIVLAATTTGVYKTTDGGISWSEVYASETSVEDLKADTSNFNYVFAGVNELGIIRSEDAGDTWEIADSGLVGSNGRFEIAISPSNPDRIFISVENNTRGSDVYVSSDRGISWNLVYNSSGELVDYLGGQPSYDNTIAVHPFNEDTAYVGGVDVWKIGVTDTLVTEQGLVDGFETVNTASFLTFINFTGNLFPGFNTGDQEEATNLEPGDFVSVEIRFGPGLSQKAHRFHVPFQATAGVTAAEYTYQDYVDVPFEVWDVTNNVQLMCSFRDQERDGAFNLYERTGDDYGQLGREYIFINSVPYNDAAPDPNIAQTGGRSFKLIYFMWPNLAEGGTWNPGSLPESKIVINYIYPKQAKGRVINVADAYGQYSERNTYDQGAGFGNTKIPGFHPDHHALTIVPIDESEGTFWIVNGNDGGLGISKDFGHTFEQITQSYTTTQFYGVAKKPLRNEYIGGMQDNGTWQSPSFKSAFEDDDYFFRIGGDGFETVWHSRDSNLIMGSIYYNDIRLSTDHGDTWFGSSSGIDDGDGPFITKLTMLPSKPDTVYAVGFEGLYYTTTFGQFSWRTIPMPSGWIAPGFGVSSSHHIKYSIADESILWAGAALSEDFGWKIFVSTDAGSTWNAVNYPSIPKDVFISNLVTHPTEPNTAYLVYSLFGEGKVLRTEDLGQTWEDITGFGASSSSNNGFPDVGCLSFFVFPDTPDRLWAGTEIGIMESLDNGDTWNLLQSNLPTVPIYQLFMQDNQIVAATYGRGIWTYQYGEELFPPKDTSGTFIDASILEAQIDVYPNPSAGEIKISIPDDISAGITNIKVYNVRGQVIESIDPKNRQVIDVDLTGRAPGTYFIHLKSSEGMLTKRLVIK